jgi:hypothetical protein
LKHITTLSNRQLIFPLDTVMHELTTGEYILSESKLQSNTEFELATDDHEIM